MTDITTPKGVVKATVVIEEPVVPSSSDESTPTTPDPDREKRPFQKFTITKVGPSAGETTTEVRELLDDDTLRATFTHTDKEGHTVTVVRVYTRVNEARK